MTKFLILADAFCWTALLFLIVGIMKCNYVLIVIGICGIVTGLCLGFYFSIKIKKQIEK